MPQHANAKANDRRLDTWKEIATFFGRNERTVKRWEADRGLPVRRVPGGGKASIYAYASELQEWLDGADSAALDGADEDASVVVPPVETPAPVSISPAMPPTSRKGFRPALFGAAAIAVMIVAALAFNIVSRSISKPYAPNPAAYGYYLKGLYAWQTRTPEGISQAVGEFNKSIAADPNFASAYAALADCYNLMQEFTATPADVAFPKAKTAALRAIALDPNLASAHRSLAFVDFWWDHDVPTAMAEFRRALQIAPNASQTHHWYANALAMTGNSQAALAEISAAEALDPGTTAILADKGLLLIDAGQPAQAADILTEIERVQPNYAPAHSYMSIYYRGQKNGPAMLHEMQINAAIRHDAAMLAAVQAGMQGYAAGGWNEMNRRMAEVEQKNFERGQSSAYGLAVSYACLGDREKAIAFLRESVARRETAALGIRTEPVFDPLYADPRFAALISDLRLPPTKKI